MFEGDKFEEVIAYGKYLDRSAHSFIHRFVARSQGEELERIEEYDVLAGMINDMLYSREQKKIHFNEGFAHSTTIGSQGVSSFGGDGNTYQPACGRGDQGFSVYLDVVTSTANDFGDQDPQFAMTIPQIEDGKFLQDVNSLPELALSLANMPGQEASSFKVLNDVATNRSEYQIFDSSKTHLWNIAATQRTNSHLKRFTIPIYSGIIGVLIPEKKLLPLNLMPLELEFTLNPYAIYCLRPNHGDGQLTRNYTINKFEIYGNVIMFEQQVHRALDQVVAKQGLYIPFNTFYLAPQTVNTGVSETQVTAFSQINVYFKSINSIHSVFLYSGYRNNVGQRKLHFVSHRLTSLQLRNGTEFTPSERILGDMGQGQVQGRGNAFYIEALKAYNKLHDPSTDAAFEGCNYFIDSLATAVFIGPKRLTSLHTQQALLGRC